MKKRWITKRNGYIHKDYCQGCLSWYCDPMFSKNSIANNKRMKRRRLKLCEACGKKECECKSRECKRYE